MLILALLTIIGVIQPITAYAADSYTVLAKSYGDYHKALYVKNTTTGEEVVGYCYNAHKGWPGIREQSVKKFENASKVEKVCNACRKIEKELSQFLKKYLRKKRAERAECETKAK